MALIPIQDLQAAVEELRRAVTSLGMLGAMLPSTALKGHLGSREYWPIYEEAERLGCCLAVHGGCHSGMGLDDMNVYPAVHGLGHSFGQMISFAGILFNGIYDRFSNIRIGFLEGGVAWLLLCLERLHESYESHIPFDPRKEFLQLRPNENVAQYITRQMQEGRIFVGCEGGEFVLPYATRVCGSEAFMYSSDFPHEVNNETVKHEIEEVLEADVSDTDKEAILHRKRRALLQTAARQLRCGPGDLAASWDHAMCPFSLPYGALLPSIRRGRGQLKRWLGSPGLCLGRVKCLSGKAVMAKRNTASS